MPDPFILITVLAFAALIPFFAVLATSFIKISVVMMLVRNALGVQQIPPNMAINALAIVLTIYIMTPVFMETWNLSKEKNLNISTLEEAEKTYNTLKVPLISFLDKHADEKEKQFFLKTTQRIWPPELQDTINETSLAIILPAFAVTELREAFEIGFLLYLPFVAIDLIISNILLAMGMMMVSPLTISLPFKLFLFVMVDGWSRLILGLITSYIT